MHNPSSVIDYLADAVIYSRITSGQSSSLSDCKASEHLQKCMDTFGPNPTANNKVKLEVFDSYNEDTKRNRWPQYTQEQNKFTGARG
jgi:hypothetical protein